MGKHSFKESNHVVFGPAPLRYSMVPDLGVAGRFYADFLQYMRCWGRKRLRSQTSGLAKIQRSALLSARVQGKNGEPLFRRSVLTGVDYMLPKVGMVMTDSIELLEAANAEIEESKKILENLANKVTAVADEVNPRLLEQTKRLRESRMTAVSEIHQSLKALREIRQFFLESDYSREIERLKEFVAVCRDLKALKQDGTLEAVSTVAIRLALKEEAE